MNSDLKACIAQVERTSRCLVNSPPKAGMYQVVEQWHPDAGRKVYAVQRLLPCSGKHSLPGALYWKNQTAEPFSSKEEAIIWMDDLKRVFKRF